MKHFFLHCLFIFPPALLSAQNYSKDSIGVRSIIQQYEDAWNKNDMDAIGNLFTEDGSWINIGGLYCKNKTEIIKAHQVFAPYLKYMIPSKMNIQKIQLISDVVALVFVHEELHLNHDLSFPDGRKANKGEVIYDQLSFVLVKYSGQWMIKAGHNTAVDPASEAINPVNKN